MQLEGTIVYACIKYIAKTRLEMYMIHVRDFSY